MWSIWGIQGSAAAPCSSIGAGRAIPFHLALSIVAALALPNLAIGQVARERERQPQNRPASEDGGPVASLAEALAMAYTSNPELQAARAQQQAEAQNVPLAQSQGLPSLVSDGAIRQPLYGASAGAGGLRRGAGLNLAVPVYSGGAVRKSVDAARMRVEGGISDLRRIEVDVLARVATAYVDVLRDQAIVYLNQKNVTTLEVNLRATRDRFEIGDVTRTDVAQSEARLALARGQLASTEAKLVTSAASFTRVVGRVPGALVWPAPPPGLPLGVESAQEVALLQNPELAAVQAKREASSLDVGVAAAGRSLRVELGATSNVGDAASAPRAGQIGQSVPGPRTSLSAQVSLPIYQGGRSAAQARQARARQSAAIESATLVERRVISQVRSAYAAHQAALRTVESTRLAVTANRLSLEGVRAERGVGNRNVLDVLNAEQELLNTEVQLVTAERNAYTASFALLVAMGRAGARDLGID